jgi:hypothetical protein
MSIFISIHQLDLLFQIEIHAERCIRAVMYAHAVSKTDVNMWAFTQNCFAESAIIHWCKIFGSRNEPTHYTKFFNNEFFNLSDGTRLTANSILARFCKSAGISESEYLSIWDKIKAGRDKFFVHNDFTESSRPELPDLDFLKSMALELRDIIHDIIPQVDADDKEFYTNFKNYVQWNTNKKYLNDLQKDFDLFRKAIYQITNTESGH